MQDVIDTINEHIEILSVHEDPKGEFTELAKRWASHSLGCYRDELLTKALNIAKALSEFDAELLERKP